MYQLIEWEVIHGKELGRQLWFRTANMKLSPHDTLEEWTYKINGLIQWEIFHGVWVYKKVDNTFEAHFFDFNKDIYGEIIQIMVLYKIRENMKFENVDELKAQIKKDIEMVKKESDYVLTFWTFDLLHPGHTYYLKRARLHGDRLVTIVATDENMFKFKGFYPNNNWPTRVSNLKELGISDIVVLWEWIDPFQWIGLYNPKVICLWYDQKGFSGGLDAYIHDNNLDIKVFRIAPFREDIYKSSKMREKL